jgi:ribulose-5-phosphate 4-epimerase/fuculose-1-phosphate aldolase
VLNAVPNWNFSVHGHPWGLTGFAYAGAPLELSEFHSSLLTKKSHFSVPVVTVDNENRDISEEEIATTLSHQAKGKASGALLIADDGPLCASKELKHLVSLCVMLENAAKSQQWKLKSP